jgi:hypothetical protein
MKVNLVTWWERAFTCEMALQRSPADRLAFHELKYLAKLRDKMAESIGEEESGFLLATAMERGIPQ